MFSLSRQEWGWCASFGNSGRPARPPTSTTGREVPRASPPNPPDYRRSAPPRGTHKDRRLRRRTVSPTAWTRPRYAAAIQPVGLTGHRRLRTQTPLPVGLLDRQVCRRDPEPDQHHHEWFPFRGPPEVLHPGDVLTLHDGEPLFGRRPRRLVVKRVLPRTRYQSPPLRAVELLRGHRHRQLRLRAATVPTCGPRRIPRGNRRIGIDHRRRLQGAPHTPLARGEMQLGVVDPLGLGGGQGRDLIGGDRLIGGDSERHSACGGDENMESL